MSGPKKPMLPPGALPERFLPADMPRDMPTPLPTLPPPEIHLPEDRPLPEYQPKYVPYVPTVINPFQEE